ncbi:hypothetical protein DFQ27_000278 [Actinomortierella ambigua]|uniref:Uncharacterized protein n=1 Tax=Actinomortierella ambigua TaxID=1343610 RepID=A0A9P6PN94_9FUNG|nr:hypothetical protein DFQ27_000278 [Actinomortierella ambigua]
MHKAILSLLAPPFTYRYITARPDKRDGVVVLAGPSNKTDQLWKVKGHSNGQITIESKAAKGKKNRYLSTGRSGNNNHALVRLGPSQRFTVTMKAGGPFTSFEMAHPKKTSTGHITVVSVSNSTDPNGNEYIAYINQNTEGHIQSFKFAMVRENPK